jgi:phosphomannomutase/phosphoglucomutase
MNPEIFREYDIRGVVARDFGDGVPERLGQAFGSELRDRHRGAQRLTVAVGRDNRPSSTGLADQLIAGLCSAGVHVVDVGTVPTPVLYFAGVHLGTDAAIQITGSHNPPEYNGFKLVMGDRPFYGEAIQRLRERIERRDFATGMGEREHQDVVPLFCDSDGTFPNHHPDPVVDENLEDLIEAVRAQRADLGIAFDGDADRLGTVDERGRIVRGDILLLLYGLDVLERRGAGQQLIFDVKCSQAVPEVFAARGGEPIMWKTGHSLIKEKMRETGAPVAGELSGHVCFADEYYGFDDALYAACRLVDMLARTGKPFSSLTEVLPHYVSTPELRVDVEESRKFDLVRQAVEEFGRNHEVIAVDGARVLFEDGWGLLRASNTQPVLVLRYEARSPEALAAIRDTFETWLRQRGVDTGATASETGG